MSKVTLEESAFIGLCFEGLFYGLYSALFVMYLRHKGSIKTNSFLFYAHCALYVLSLATIVLDITFIHGNFASSSIMRPIYVIAGAIPGCCDFISQCSLIYRCWVVWNRNYYMIIVPSVLAFAFLVLWLLAPVKSFHIEPHQFVTANWGDTIFMATCLAMSLTVNVLVTGLIIFKIFKVYLEVKPLYGKTFCANGGSRLRPVMFIIMESGVALFSIQLARLVLTFMSTNTATNISQPIIGIHQMLIGITPTILQVRVSMGFSFHDKESMVEATSGLNFGSINHPETEISTVSSEFQNREVIAVLSTFPIQFQEREPQTLSDMSSETESIMTTPLFDYTDVISLPPRSQGSNIRDKQAIPINMNSYDSDNRRARISYPASPPRYTPETSRIFFSPPHFSPSPPPLPPPAYHSRESVGASPSREQVPKR